MKLTKKQTQALDILEDPVHTELLFGGGAGGAKSALGCYWQLKRRLKYPGTRGLLGRTVLKTLKETTLNTFWWVCAQQGVARGSHFKYNEQKSLITFYNGSEILLKDLDFSPSDPNFDELGSLELTDAFIDECNQTRKKAWDIVKSRIRYRLDEYGLMPKQLGTCNPAHNWAYTEFFDPDRKGRLRPDRAFIQSLLGDNPYISQHYRTNLMNLENASRQRLLFGNWDYNDDPAILCDFEAISDVFTNEFVKTQANHYISADIATRGRDHFVAGFWDGWVCNVEIDKEVSTGKSNEKDLAKMMREKAVPRSQTIVDSDGLGDYLESYLTGIKEFHGGTPAVNKKEFANLKSECGYKLAEMINKHKLLIICKNDTQKSKIIEELQVLKAKNPDADEQRKRLISKDEMKEQLGRSPDYLDMLLMRMYFEIKKPIDLQEGKQKGDKPIHRHREEADQQDSEAQHIKSQFYL